MRLLRENVHHQVKAQRRDAWEKIPKGEDVMTGKFSQVKA